jgi:CubicO group peptidase (beta-lactamase class C family)
MTRSERRRGFRIAGRCAAGLVAAALSLLWGAVGARTFEDTKKHYDRTLEKLVKGKGPTDPIAAAALAVMVDGEIVYAGAAGCAEFEPDKRLSCRRPFKPETKFRVASISKMALAMGIQRLVDDGRIDPDLDASDYLGWTLRNPSYPDRPITTRQLLAHVSSIRDPEEYWVDAPGSFRSLFDGQTPPFAAPEGEADAGPGAWFKYANLNYGVLAGVIEGASGERFDRYMSERVFKPLELDIGYNWSGVEPSARRNGAVLYLREGKAWTVAVDGPPILNGDAPVFRAAGDMDKDDYLARYRPGDNPTLFAPQGGLRASVVDLVRLVRIVSEEKTLTAPAWRFDPAHPNGDPENGYYGAFGLGVQTVPRDASLLGGRDLVGHPGEAYGVYSGAWASGPDRADAAPHDIAFAFAATGVSDPPPKGVHPTFNAIEERLVRLALKAAEDHAAKSTADEPRPFDPEADAMRDVDAALAAAGASGKNVLLVLGGNWCHDSRGLAAKFQTPELAAIIEAGFHLVWVDVGQRDRNLEVAARFGVEKLIGTPTILVLSPDGALLNADSVNQWTTADSRPLEEAIRYFKALAGRRD